jgi:hypothetical protein
MNLTEEDARKIAHTIAFGHAYWKHIANGLEAGDLITESTFEQLILQTLLSPGKSRRLRGNRVAFWNTAEGLLVIYNPSDPDLGTAYWPIEGQREYESLF